ncbi:MAG TPA: SPOCS domain-containing protein [Ruminiclostridium sp.]
MSLELIKEAFKVKNLMGEDTIQTVIENDIIVPDTKPDIARVLLIDGDVFVTGCDTGTDRVVNSGCIMCKILYISDDETKSVKSIISNIPFSYTLDIPGVRSGMKGRAKGIIEHIDYTLLNGRKISVKAILSINCKVNDEIEREFSCGIAGVEDIQVLKDSVVLNTYLGSNKVNYVIKEDLDLPSSKPSISEILRNDVKISGKDFKVAEGKIFVKGDIGISTLYIADDETRSMQYMENEVAFTQFVELDDVDEDTAVNVDYDLIDYKIEAMEDSDGDLRNIRAEIALNIYVNGVCQKTVEVLSDAYSPKSRIALERQQLSLDEIFSENRSQIIIKDMVDLSECSPEVAEIFNVLCKYNVSESRIEDGKVIIEGSVQSNILYLANSEDQPVFCHKKDIPFRHEADIAGISRDMKADVSLEIEHCNYSMISSNQVEIRAVIGVDTRVETKKIVPVINKINENVIDEKRLVLMPSVIVYIIQPGDSLWKIAKKYGITVEDLMKINNLTEKDMLMPGQHIIILKKVA